MPERDGYIPGVPCWVDTTQPDPDAAAAFYRGLFGWEFEETMPAGSGGKYLIARVRGGDVAAVSSQPEGAPSDAVWNTYIWVENADAAAAKAREAGGSVAERAVRRHGRRPDGGARRPGRGRVLRLAGAQAQGCARRQRAGLAELQRPQHPRPGGGEELLRRRLRLDDARPRRGEFWALPGYGDYLETLTPGIRQRTAELGAAGFEDVVAAIAPIAGDDPDSSAHWGVTFSTADADATAAKAAELGGTVVAPPIDAPYSRMTELGDPQGATFFATAFVPENKDVGRKTT